MPISNNKSYIYMQSANKHILMKSTASIYTAWQKKAAFINKEKCKKNPNKKKPWIMPKWTGKPNRWKHKNVTDFTVKRKHNTGGKAKTEFEDQLPNGNRTWNKSFFKYIRIRKSANDYVGSTDNWDKRNI